MVFFNSHPKAAKAFSSSKASKRRKARRPLQVALGGSAVSKEASLAGPIAAAPQVSPFSLVVTDRYGAPQPGNDFAPGDQVLITAMGCAPGSVIRFHLYDDPNAPGVQGAEPDPLIDDYGFVTIKDGGPDDADPRDGYIGYLWTVPPADAKYATVLVTAEDLKTGAVATASFTDAPVISGLATNPINLTTPQTYAPVTSSFDNGTSQTTTAYWSNVKYGSGTGVIQPFLRVEQPGNQKYEQGFNTDAKGQLNNKNDPFTHSLKLSDVPVVVIKGQEFFEFRIDINESKSLPYLSLDALRIFQGTQANLSGYTGTAAVGSVGGFGNALAGQPKLVYDQGNNWIQFDYRLQPGSGYGDASVLIPKSTFNNDPYVTLYCALGYRGTEAGKDWSAEAGFEEWDVVKSSVVGADVKGFKFYDIDSDGKYIAANGDFLWTLANFQAIGQGAAYSAVTIYLDLDNDGSFLWTDSTTTGTVGAWDAGEGDQWTVVGADGTYTFKDLAAGLGPLSTYTIRELEPAIFKNTGPANGTFQLYEPGDVVALGKSIIVNLTTGSVVYDLTPAGGLKYPAPGVGLGVGFGNYAPFSPPPVDVTIDKLIVCADDSHTFTSEDASTTAFLAGSSIYYRFVVTNTSDIFSVNVTIDDDLIALNGLSGDANTSLAGYQTTLLAGATITLETAPAPAQAGPQPDTATVTGNFVYLGATQTLQPVNDSNGYLGATLDVDVDKTVSCDGETWLESATYLDDGLVQFKYVITNNSNVSGVVVATDDDLGEVFSGTLAAGASTTVYATDVWASGSQTNTVTASLQYTDSCGDTDGGQVTATDAVTYFGATLDVDVDKSVSCDGETWLESATYLDDGLVQFKYVITNNSNVSGVVVATDDDLGEVFSGTLAAGASTTVYATDVWASGSQTNTVTASLQYTDSCGDTDGGQVTATDAVTYFGATLDVDVDKSVSCDGETWLESATYLDDGLVQFKYVITNNSNVSGVVVATDDDLGEVFSGTLAAGASTTVYATDVWASGSQTNTVTASLQYTDSCGDTDGGQVTATDAVTYFGATLDVDVDKSVSCDGETWLESATYLDDGLVQFKYVITNNSNVSGVVVATDDDLGEVFSGTLAAGASTTVYATDVWASGSQTNTVTASLQYTDSCGDTDGGQVTATDAVTYFGATLDVDVDKSVSCDGETWLESATYLDDGLVQFKYVITNNSNVSGVVVATDDDLGEVFSGTLAAGASTTVYATDVWASGSQTNTVTASLQYTDSCGDTDGGQVTATDAVTYFGATLDVDVDKSVSCDGETWLESATYLDDGLVQFKYVITNNSNVSGVVVATDDDLGEVFSGTLAAGASTTVYATDVWASGSQTNTVTASLQYTDSCGDTDGGQVTATDAVTYFGATLDVDVDKSVSCDGETWLESATYLDDGLVQFKYVITNNSNVSGVVVATDDDLGEVFSGTLAAGASTTVYATDVWASGSQTNTVTASLQYTDSCGDTDGGQVTATDAVTYFGATLDVDVDKSVSCDGETWLESATYLDDGLVQFKYVITNNSNVSGVVVATDDDLGEVFSGTLAAGASTTVYATDVWASGSQTNTVTASLQYTDSCGDTDGGQVTATDAVTYFGATPSIDVEKEVSVDGGATWQDADTPLGPILPAGISPIFRFTVTNNGDVDLSNVTLTDDAYDIDGDPSDSDNTINIGALAAGADYVVTFTAPYAAGNHVDTATASGTFTDSCGDTATVNDTDMAYYQQVTIKSLFTNTEKCTFDAQPGIEGDQFNINFVSKKPKYSISATNPGQFYYNMFYQGAANEVVDITVTFNAPFVLNGAQAVHAYDGVMMMQDPLSGEICLQGTGNSVAFDSSSILYSYVDTNGDGKKGWGDTYTYTVKGVSLGSDGFAYVDMHLEFGLLGTGGWSKVGGTNDFTSSYGTIVNNSATTFSYNANGGGVVDSATVYNYNKTGSALLLDNSLSDGTAAPRLASASALTGQDLQKGIEQALAYLASAGISADLITGLRNDVHVGFGDLSNDDPLMLGVTMQGSVGGFADCDITIDDDGAGYGWSTSADQVAPGQVDLQSTLVHEYGHCLGFDHSTMDELLKLGQRELWTSVSASSTLI